MIKVSLRDDSNKKSPFRKNEEMKEDLLSAESIKFSIEIVRYYKWLVNTHNETVLSKQILRSGTSIGANIHEAKYAASRQDFIAKLQIALKEASETEYWLIVLSNCEYLPEGFQNLKKQLLQIKRILISSIKTAKSKI